MRFKGGRLIGTTVQLLCFLLLIVGVNGNVKLVSGFRSKTPINNVLIVNDKIYISAVNSLYRLNATDLNIVAHTTTGPVLDSPQCSPDLSTCIGNRDSIRETDNVNKILELFPRKDQLLVCGSVRQGSCEWRETSTLRIVSESDGSTVPVAANSPDASTVASWFAEQPHGEENLYVASSYGADSPYREAFPAIATRSLPSLLPLNSGSIDGEAAVVVRAEFRSRFRVRYVSTFQDEHYVYWAAVQNRDIKGTSLTNPQVSRLIRVCRNDDKYISYSEIEIQCRGEDNTNYNVLRDLKKVGTNLIAVFNDANGRNSAICVFAMPKIRLTFWYNIDRCWGGTDSIGLAHIGRDSKCINKSRLALSEDTCLLGVGGTIEASEMAAAHYSERVLTAIAGRNVHGHDLVVAGSSTGEILQMELLGDHNKRLEQYDDFITGPDAVERIQFMNDEQFLVTSGNEVLAYRISVCPSKADCSRCVDVRDPLCGFCLSEGRCTAQITCQSPIVRQCPKSSGNPTPSNSSLASNEGSVFVPVENLPEPETSKPYECYFGAFKSEAKWTSSGIRCQLPDQRPQLSIHQDSAVVLLSVRSSGASHYDLVKQNFTCSKCAQSSWPCGWCAAERRCVSSERICGDSPLATEDRECARIEISAAAPLLVSDGTNSSLSFSVANMINRRGEKLECSIGEVSSHPTTSGRQVVSARFVSDSKIQCDPTVFHYNRSDVSKSNFTLELLQNSELIDQVPVSVYKCEAMATDCSQCIGLDAQFHCSWCGGACRFHEKCPLRSHRQKSESICTEPFIQSFSPTSGPLEGGTRIEIRGRDLGSRLRDVRDRVLVAGVKCRVVDYEISVRIGCILESGKGSGPVRITIGQSGQQIVESTDHFHFREPMVQSFYPRFGPKSGGTVLTLKGENLDVGANATVWLDEMECKLIDEKPRQSNELKCETARSDGPKQIKAIRLQIDDTTRVLNSHFDYRSDPSIESISPLVSIESGGRRLIVEGLNLDSILTARLFLFSDVDSEFASLVSEAGNCDILNSTQMTCDSPRLIRSLVNAAGAGRHGATFNRFPVGFTMDAVENVRNLGRRMQMTVVPDPQFKPFNGVRTLSLGQPLVIEGQKLELAATPLEFNVTIGTVQCPVIVLEPHQLVCRTPDVIPPSTDDFGRELKDGRALVVVRVGGVRSEIGPLEFADSANIQSSAFVRTNLLRFIIATIFAFGFLAAGCILLYCLWQRRSTEHERVYKRIQQQMEQMEYNVRNECREAFSELQTDIMGDLSASMDDLGVPLHDRNEFIGRLLFRESLDSAILNGYGTTGTYTTRLPMAIIQFESLLFCRQFVFVLVRMVENNPAVSAAERCTLSSLLMSALSKDMAYCTEVMFSLLASHIQSVSQSRNAAALLFRRSDSLIEKMFQQWLSFVMHPALMEPNGPARQFFLLYKALKYQSEKGPVDFCTGNARYTLSEQKLLRESVECSPIVLMILPVAGFDQSPIPLRVLECDTISQIKSKLLDILYRNIPFSKRMTVDQFDLEWRCPRRGNILLLDDDQPQLKGVKKLHTIRYYGLQSNSVLTMQQRGQHSFTFRSESGGSSDTTCSAWSSTHLIDSNGLPVSPLGSSCHPTLPPLPSNHPQSIQYFHLVPPQSGTLHTIQKHTNTLLALDKRNRKKQHVLKRHNSQQRLFAEDCTTTKNIPEVFLTRLVMCKGTVQQYIDAFFDAITFASSNTNEIPVVLKYVLDFLDQEAARNNITDPDIVHAWKTNAYVLRFWMQLLHNSDCLFDIQRQASIDASLTVIGQTMVDAFSRTDLPLNKDSPSSKLLFAKDIARYRPVATRMFSRIRQHPSVDDDKFYEYVRSLSNTSGVSTHIATTELLNWSKANILRLSDMLDDDPTAVKLRLGGRFEEAVRCSLTPSEPDHVYATLQ
ncbi:hypothetical protein M3Y98_00220500 [Aphelenchoides besseyi]|nr:hypothetical protein M3Y98_00220500 [Aphelenchoides besseyi]KAI6200482.1 hypothetical protein M3Y96_00738700 [Aphelenchoides besseyi]